jgi:hypothetical protein
LGLPVAAAMIRARRDAEIRRRGTLIGTRKRRVDMHASTNIIQARPSLNNHRARALVRFNPLLFHALATASFLEASAPRHASRLAAAVAAEPDAAHWVESVWRREREARGRELRAYIEATWPEFDWSGAYEDFCSAHGPRPGRTAGVQSPRLGSLERCAIESQAAAFYRAIARCADDPALRELAAAAAGDHVHCFEFFKSRFARRTGTGRIGLMAACRAVLETSRAARDLDVAAAFSILGAHWYGTPTVSQLGYEEFLGRMAQLILRHAGLGRVGRLVFHPWLRPPRPVAPSAGHSSRGAVRPAPWPSLKAAA